MAWLWISLPSLPVDQRSVRSGNVLALLGEPRVALGMLPVGALFAGQFMLWTYLRPFLETVTRVQLSTLSMILLMIGVAGLIGSLLIDKLLKRSLYRTLALAPLLMAGAALALMVWGTSQVAVVALLTGWGFVATATPAGWWTCLARALPERAETGGGLIVAVVQMAIALGSTVGGLLFDALGYLSTFAVSAVLLVIASGLVTLTQRADIQPH